MSRAYSFFTEGKKLYKNKQFLKAAMLFEKSKSLEPDRGSIRELLAASYFNLGLIEASKENFIKALEIDHCNDYAHFGIGLCLEKEGNIDKARGHLKLAAIMKPKNEHYKQALKRLQK